MDDQLVDRIYESAFLPEAWPSVLEDLAGIANARTGWLHLTFGDTHRATASKEANFRDIIPLVESGWIARSDRVARFFAAKHAGFLREIDVFKGDELEDHFKNDPTCREILIPRGVGRVAATMLELPTADKAFISLDREWVKGPVEDDVMQRLDLLRPHLARGALMSSRLQLQEARIAGETLAGLGLPALVLDYKGAVLSANPLIEELRDLVSWRARDRVMLNDKVAEKLFCDAMLTIDQHKIGVRSFPVRDAQGEAKHIAHVLPIRLSARDIFVHSTAALVLTPVSVPEAPSAELVQSLFDLTPAEARVARSLAEGKTLDDIAALGNVTLNTVRTQLRAVMEKTGCSRQAEAVALLGGIGLPPLRPR